MNICITGASRGIGLELVRRALEKNHFVLALVRNLETAQDLVTLQTLHHEKLIIAQVNLSADNLEQDLIAATSCWNSLDILINNAGIYQNGTTPEDFAVSFQVNSVVPFRVTQALISKLRLASKPKVIQITSLMGSIGDNDSGGSTAYRASKAALNMITKTMAKDQPWLTFGLVHPGWVKTKMGGPDAPLSTESSAKGIWKVIDQLTLEKSGSFLDYENESLPW